MADAAETVKGFFSWKTMKTILTLGVVGSVATAGGLILLPFFGVAAGGAAATAGATNGAVLGSFWAPLFTSTAGEVGVTAGISKMFSGYAALAKSGWSVASAGGNAAMNGGSVIGAVQSALAAPAATL